MYKHNPKKVLGAWILAAIGLVTHLATNTYIRRESDKEIHVIKMYEIASKSKEIASTAQQVELEFQQNLLKNINPMNSSMVMDAIQESNVRLIKMENVLPVLPDNSPKAVEVLYSSL